jgi:spore coat polysaccharide biosynthesis protein SpsF
MILAVVQARVSSSRLPGKVLLPILGKPMLQLHLERLRRMKMADELVVATSDGVSDDPLAGFCRQLGVSCFRGSLEDVLDRFYQAAREYRPAHVVRLTGDCPLADPALIDEIVRYHIEGGYDYTSNTITPTYPDGLDAEVVRFECLETAWREARLPSQREHVTPFIWSQPDRFKLANYENEEDLSDLRWTVDEPQDFELIEMIYRELYPDKPDFDRADVLRLVRSKPELQDVNQGFARNEGLAKSLKQDRQEVGHE